MPTILASTLVLFLGIELMAEALWHTLETLLWSEYAVVLGTLLSCTFIGFAPGFGVGIGLAVVLHFAWGVVDTVGHLVVAICCGTNNTLLAACPQLLHEQWRHWN